MNNISVVVVTYNRKDLLVRCLEHISQQTLPPSNIIIVDNASTDGTSEVLDGIDNLHGVPVTALHLPINIGGAGGFKAGIEHAMHSGASQIWLMDDDGFPNENCLQILSQAKLAYGWLSISPIQVQVDYPDRLSFPISLGPNHPIALSIDEAQVHKLISGFANLFNGMLVDSDVFRKIGLPNEAFFIRGDEEELLHRLQKASVPFGTCTEAVFFHPTDQHERHSMWNGLMSIRDAGHPYKNYYLYRNKIKLLRLRGAIWKLGVDFIKYFLYYIIYRKFDIKGYVLWLRATFDGLMNKAGDSF